MFVIGILVYDNKRKNYKCKSKLFWFRYISKNIFCQIVKKYLRQIRKIFLI